MEEEKKTAEGLRLGDNQPKHKDGVREEKYRKSRWPKISQKLTNKNVRYFFATLKPKYFSVCLANFWLLVKT